MTNMKDDYMIYILQKKGKRVKYLEAHSFLKKTFIIKINEEKKHHK